MNWQMIEGNWKQFKGRARKKWGELTDDDLDRVAGRRTELVGVLQARYGKAKEQAEREADEWLKKLEEPASTGAR
jgi:uncharacterized protein YjbJ (UPF0337 family)